MNAIRSRRTQSGITILGFLFVLVVLAFVGFIGLKLLPVYTESFKIDKALQGVIESEGIQNQSKRDIALAVTRRLDIDSVTSITEANYRDYMTIIKEGGVVTITADYESQVPLFENMTLVIKFSKKVTQE